ncbi:MAG: DUF433 domain-containing protein [Pseudomonas mandelii]
MQNTKLLSIGLYTAAEAALYTRIPTADIRRWLFGYTSQGVRHPGLWGAELGDLDERVLGFHDLLEVRFVQALRQHGVSLQAIRKLHLHAKGLFSQTYPFTCRRFQIDGRRVFPGVLNETEDRALPGWIIHQRLIKQLFNSSLYEGIDYAGSDTPLRWYPVKGSKAIVLDPSRNFGKPVLSDEGIDTAAIFNAYQAQRKDLARVARLYEIPPAAVEEAVRFEQRNTV